MELVKSFETSGNVLFKNRSWLPVILLLISIPVIYITDYSFIEKEQTFYDTLLIVCISITILGQIIRAIAIGTSAKNTSGRNTSEGQVADSLNTTGIYSMLRHPLYLGNYFMWIGIVSYVFNIWFIIIVTLMFWLYYERIMFAEERFLERKFKNTYLNWTAKTPAFIPSLKNYTPNKVEFSFKTVLRREYSGVTNAIIAFVFVDVLRDLFLSIKNESTYQFNTTYLYFLALAVLVTLVLRSLKKYTKILYQEDRS